VVKVKMVLNKRDTDSAWNQFAVTHPDGCLYHALAWHEVIKKSYGHTIYYLAALAHITLKRGLGSHREIVLSESPIILSDNFSRFVGLLPLVHIKNWLFGNSVISMPFVDSGGLLAEDELTEESMLLSAIKLAEKIKVTYVDLRQNHQLIKFNYDEFFRKNHLEDWRLSALTPKVRMIINLPEHPDLLMRSFDSKLRSQIRKPIKAGLVVKIGGIELIDDFYNIFAENMRDLGSPVHSKKFLAETLKAFTNTAKVFVVYSNGKPLASSVAIGFKDTLSNPWASSLRRYSHLAPNMLLYWSMLEFSCQQRYKKFDFGRSTIGEGTYKFKEQWGAKPEPLYWYRLSNTDDQSWSNQPNKDKMRKAIEYWKKLPVPLTKIIGPRIRKYISL
jgi:FemAB-related protein (PEP-CTERM system-associated)